MGIRADRAAATRGKLLEAARDEFQRNGFAGGRIDAIADRAGVNKRLIYAHFNSKAELFDVVLADNVARVAANVPFTPNDLPGYAVRLFDYWSTDPTSVRLFSWRNVELGSAPQLENETYREMIGEIEASGAVTRAGIPATHLLALLFSVLLAWAIPADVYLRTDEAELEQRRRSVKLAVERIIR
jgi:AcrR family transcriptional regulator